MIACGGVFTWWGWEVCACVSVMPSKFDDNHDELLQTLAGLLSRSDNNKHRRSRSVGSRASSRGTAASFLGMDPEPPVYQPPPVQNKNKKNKWRNGGSKGQSSKNHSGGHQQQGNNNQKQNNKQAQQLKLREEKLEIKERRLKNQKKKMEDLRKRDQAFVEQKYPIHLNDGRVVYDASGHNDKVSQNNRVVQRALDAALKAANIKEKDMLLGKQGITTPLSTYIDTLGFGEKLELNYIASVKDLALNCHLLKHQHGYGNLFIKAMEKTTDPFVVTFKKTNKKEEEYDAKFSATHDFYVGWEHCKHCMKISYRQKDMQTHEGKTTYTDIFWIEKPTFSKTEEQEAENKGGESETSPSAQQSSYTSQQQQQQKHAPLAHHANMDHW